MKEVAIEKVMQLIKELAEINEIPFSEIVWTFAGFPLKIDKEIAEEFRFTGLSNKDFINFYYDENGRKAIKEILSPSKEETI